MATKDKTRIADNGQISAEEAQAVLTEQRQKRVETCRDEIQTILEKHGCLLSPTPFIADGRILARLEIVTRD